MNDANVQRFACASTGGWATARTRAGLARRVRHTLAATVILTASWLMAAGGRAHAEVQPAYLFTLSSFAGPIRYDWVRLHVDPRRNETYVIYQNLVRIFGPSGMEVFSFGDDLQLGHILDAAVDRNGDILLLSYQDGRSLVTRCSYRGVPSGPFEIRNLPDGLTFAANRLIQHGEQYYFVSHPTASVIVTDASGGFVRHIDLLSVVEPDDRKTGTAGITGFTVDHDGTVFFSIASRFRVYRLATDGTQTSFGSSGSAPGRFGVIAGLATDSQGNLLVADKLKCVIMVFDREFKLLAEFGYRGPRPENLIVPDDLAVDGRDRVYVSQGRRRGVSVFALGPR